MDLFLLGFGILCIVASEWMRGLPRWPWPRGWF